MSGRGKLILATLLAAVLFADVLVSKAVFYSACLIQGGQEIYRTESPVDGILMAGDGGIGCASICKELLGTKKYRFVEVDVRIPESFSLATARGLHRYHLAAAGSAECAPYDRLIAKSPILRSSNEERFGVPASTCIVGVAVSESQARYQYVTTYYERVYADFLGIWKGTETLSERASGNTIAKSTRFYRNNGWTKQLTLMIGFPAERCTPFERSVIDGIESILKPP